MPELPEVETVRKSLSSFIVGKKVKNIKVIYPPIIANVSPQVLENRIIGNIFSKVDRIGKFLLLRIGTDTLVSHLRMEGKYYFGKYKGSLKNRTDLVEVDLNSERIDQFHKHIHVIFEFDDRSLLIYHDTRKFGKFHLFKTGEELNKAPLSKVGNEPFTLKPQTLFNNLKKRTIPIKQALLAQDLIAGLGNIYVDETLFLSKINPFTPANKISLKETTRLVDSAVAVLNKAINLGGSTIRSYHVDNEVSGKFQNELFVYGKEGQLCKNCKTIIIKTFINGRGTHFCPLCQPKILDTGNRIIGVTGIMNSGKSTVAAILTKFGYEKIDADQLAKKAYQDQKVLKLVVKSFGKDVANKEGIDFEILRSKALENKNGLKILETIIHPYVIKETKQIINNNHDKKYVLDIPLLFESGMDKLCDTVIFVSINENAWKKRIIKANKMTLKQAKLMRQRLISNHIKIKSSNIILENSSTLSELKRQINRFSRFFNA